MAILLSEPHQALRSRGAGTVLPEDEAIALLQTCTGSTDTEALTALVQALGGVSTALVLATAYMSQTAVSVQDYVLAYQRKKAALLKKGPLNIEPVDLPIALSAQLSIEHLQSLKPRAYLDWLLTQCAYLSPHSIPKNLLCLALTETGFLDLRDKLAPFLAQLANYGFVQNRTRDTLCIDPRLQHVLRQQSPQPEQYYEMMARLCLFAFNQTVHTADPATHQKKLLPHLEHLSRCRPPQHSSTLDHLEACLSFNRALVYQTEGDLHQAHPYFEQALSLYTQLHGPETLEIATTLFNLSLIYEQWGDLVQQQHCLARALAIERAHYGADDPRLVGRLSKLGEVHARLGNIEEAHKLLSLALSLKERHSSEEDLEGAILLQNLGNTYGDLGNALQQKNLLERALAMEQRLYGFDHPDLAITLMNLSCAYDDLGDHLKQRHYLEEALRIKEGASTEEDLHLGMILGHLGLVYYQCGDLQKSEHVLERALTIQERFNGLEHPKLILTLLNLAKTSGDLGHYPRQILLLERALKIKTQAQQEPDRETGQILAALAEAQAAFSFAPKSADQ